MSEVTLNIKKIIDTFQMKVHIAIPAENPLIEGFITVDYAVLSPDERDDLNKQKLSDEEYFKRLVKGIHGLGSPDTGEALAGEAAIQEVLKGKYALYLRTAILERYWEQYGEALQGNSPKRR